MSLMTLATFAIFNVAALRWHVVGECFTGFFPVWTVYHHCDLNHQIAGTQRDWLKNVISYDMFIT